MFEGREEHLALVSASAVLCLLGTVLLTVGLFVFYTDAHAGKLPSMLAGGGSLAFISGMLVSQYAKRRSRQ
jgi:hypothetical protein